MRHYNIQQKQVRLELVCHPDGICGLVFDANLVKAGQLKVHLQQPGGSHFVIHNQYASSWHKRAPYPAFRATVAKTPPPSTFLIATTPP